MGSALSPDTFSEGTFCSLRVPGRLQDRPESHSSGELGNVPSTHL